jgi:hypothetical protein
MCKPDYYLWTWQEESIKDISQLRLIKDDFQHNQEREDQIISAENKLGKALEEIQRLDLKNNLRD